MNRVEIVILNWNGVEDTIKCLNSLQQQTYNNFKIIVIDNGSTDNSCEILDNYKKDHKNTETIYKKDNLGFAGGVNIGIKYAIKNKFDYVVLFNNDAIATKEWLKELVLSAEKTGASIVTSCLLKKDKSTIDSTGDWYSIWGLPFPRGRNKKINKSYNSGFIFGASGGASLYDVNIFKKIGLFDENFFAYYEDVDVSFRAQLAGYKIYFSRNAIAYHDHGSTSKKISGFTTYQTFKNLPLLYIKNVPSDLLFIVGVRFFFAYTLIFWHAVFNGNIKSAFSGFAKSLSLTLYAIKQRKIIQSTIKIVDSKYIKDLMWPDLPPDQTGIRRLLSLFKR
jgi:GT2 family glycosyltransferase